MSSFITLVHLSAQSVRINQLGALQQCYWQQAAAAVRQMQTVQCKNPTEVFYDIFLYYFNYLFTGKQKGWNIYRKHVNWFEFCSACFLIIFVHLYGILCMIFFCINMYLKICMPYAHIMLFVIPPSPVFPWYDFVAFLLPFTFTFSPWCLFPHHPFLVFQFSTQIMT